MHSAMNTPNNIKPVRKAVFPVAGLGTRFLPATKVMPKEMLTLVDRPLIQHAVEEAQAAGIEEFIFVISKGKEILKDHFIKHDALTKTLEARGKTEQLATLKSCEIPTDKLHLAYQDEPLGLGHAIWCARDFVGDEPFAIMLPDDVVLGDTGCLTQMIDTYNNAGGNLVGVMDVPKEDTNKYGILDVHSDDGKLADIKGLVEKPDPEDAPSTLSIIGRYILQPEIFEKLSGHEKGAGGEIQLTDAMAKLIGAQPFNGLRFDGTRYDCGHHLGFIEANIAYSMHNKNIGPQVKEIIEKIANGPKEKIHVATG